MINILRKNQKWLWIVIGILAIPFVFYFVQKPDYASMHSELFGRIYDRNITRTEAQRSARLFGLARDLGMFTFLQDMVPGASDENQAVAEFIPNVIILRHEADRFGIRPSSAEVADVVRKLQPFQGKSGFDISKYNEFTQEVLPRFGFNESQLEELAGDQIILERIKKLIATGVAVPESEMRSDYEQAYGKIDVVVARLPDDEFARQANITEADIEKYYDAHKKELNTEEKRKVELVRLGLNDEQKKLTGKERIDVLQKLSNEADDFTQALLEKGADFKEVAARFKASIQETGDFTKSAADPLLSGQPQLAEAAFHLSKDQPNSDAVQAPDGFYIMHLVGVTPARTMTLEEAKPKIVETLQKERVHELMASKAADAAGQIRTKMKSGATAEEAMQQAGLKPERIAPFSLAENPFEKISSSKATATPAPTPSPDLPSVKQAVASLSPGEVSDLVPTKNGGLIAVLVKREPIDETQFTLTRPMLEGRLLQGMQRVVFLEWLNRRRAEAGLQTAGS
jgi:peptidyl-prolyl cis-trans isomerase D